MYICICNAITDRQINEAVAKGATTLADLQHELGVATECGTCLESASQLLPSPILDHTLHVVEITRTPRLKSA